MFNVFKKILSNKPLDESDAKKVQPFILLRWLSGDPRLLPLAVQLNQLKNQMDILDLITSIQKSLANKIKFIKYPSSKKADMNNEDLRILSEYFNVGEEEAKEYHHWMLVNCPHEIEIIRGYFKCDQIKGV